MRGSIRSITYWRGCSHKSVHAQKSVTDNTQIYIIIINIYKRKTADLDAERLIIGMAMVLSIILFPSFTFRMPI